jgi:hypothetical protein
MVRVFEAAYCSDQLQPCAHSPLCVVFIRLRIAPYAALSRPIPYVLRLSGWQERWQIDYWRGTPLPGAVLTRVASSHIRVGTLQFFAARGDLDAVRRLADHVIARHYPEAVEAANRYRTLLDLVISRQAALIAKWLLVGFISWRHEHRQHVLGRLENDRGL